jgi:hypothetical protein
MMEQPQILLAKPCPTLALRRCPKIARETADETLAVVIDLDELPAALIAARFPSPVGMDHVIRHNPKLSGSIAGAYERNISSQTGNTQQPYGHSPASISAANEASGELGLPLSNSI